MADMITQLLNYVVVLIAMFVINPLICLFVLAMMVFQSAIEVWRTKRLRKDDKVYRSVNERFYDLVVEMVRGAKDVRLLHSEKDFTADLCFLPLKYRLSFPGSIAGILSFTA